MTRIVKIMLMLSVGLFGAVGFMSNMLDFAPGHEQVRTVLSMEGATGTPGMEWRRITSPLVVHLGFALIYLTKLTVAVLCTYSAFQMFQARDADVATFDAAKRLGLLACGVAVVTFFVGFIVIAENFFEYWRVPILGMATHHFAASYIMLIIGFVLVVQLPEKAKA
jgi:predicted small integral membrane protein